MATQFRDKEASEQSWQDTNHLLNSQCTWETVRGRRTWGTADRTRPEGKAHTYKHHVKFDSRKQVCHVLSQNCTQNRIIHVTRRGSPTQGHTGQGWVPQIKQTRENTKHLLRVAIPVVSSAGDMVIHVSVYMDVYIHASIHVYVPSTVLDF